MTEPAHAQRERELDPHSHEARARIALEEAFGRPFSEEEWQRYRRRLIAYATVLQEWNKKR